MNLPDPEQFNFKECVIGGDECWLITPNDMGTAWTDDIARFRSCIVRKSDNFVVSQGFGKFVNFGERPEFQPWDDNWKFEARHKLDGSLLIVSRYKGEWILRTRGTVDARQLPNGYEIDLLMEKYSDFFHNQNEIDSIEALNQTILFEWVTPSNIIVLRESNEPKLILLGIVCNSDGYYYPQPYVDAFAKGFSFDRPVKYEYNSVAECIADVKAWEGKEGVVIYSPDYQTMKKIKSDIYCELHKLATGMTNVKHVLDVFIVSPRFAKYSEFYEYIEKTIDYEVAEKCKDWIREICVAYSTYLDKLCKVKNFVDQIRDGFSRKEQALAFQDHWTDWRLRAAFNILDGRELDDNLVRKAMEHELKL